MRKLLLIIAVLFGFIGAKAQNPFAEYGYTPKIATLSQGQYNEFFDNDTIVQIGSVLYNTKSREIVAFVDSENQSNVETIQPDVVSRWLSPDPLADHPTQISLTPYHYAGNNPIYWTDPDGRCPWCLVWLAVEVGFAIYDAYDAYQTINDESLSTTQKVGLVGTTVATNVLFPGGGYSAGTKTIVKSTTAITKRTSAEILQSGAQMYNKMRKSSRLSANMTKAGTKISGQAHHVLPLQLLKENKYVVELVEKGYDIEKATNGLDLAKGFHTTHPGYTKYVNQQINNYVEKFGSVGLGDFIDKTLAPQLKKISKQAESTWLKSGKKEDSLNSFFNNLLKK